MSLQYNYEDDYLVNGNITSFPNKKQFRELTKRQRRQLRKDQQQAKNSSLKIRNIQPKTDNQDLVFRNFDDGYNLLLHGLAGTGKTFISLYLALSEVLKNETPYDKEIIVRSLIPTREIGFLPGDEEDKAALYQVPYANMAQFMFKQPNAQAFNILYDRLKAQGSLYFL